MTLTLLYVRLHAAMGIVLLLLVLILHQRAMEA
jgi:hypothetical protein